MMTYEIDYSIYDTETGKLIDSDSAYTKAESLVKAQNNIAWRMVIEENDDAEYPGETIEFDDGRQIIGNQKSVKNTPLYIILMQDLHANGVYVDMDYAKQLRQKFNVTHKDYAVKSTQVINYMKGIKEENAMKNAIVENNVENTNVQEEENMEIKTLYKDVNRTNKKVVRQISNQVLSMIIDKKTNEEKHLFSQVFNILYASGAYMDIAEEDDKVTVFFGDAGIVIPAKCAIEFAREIYIEVQDPEWVSTRNAQAIRARLTELFKPANEKQVVNPYAELAEQTTPKTELLTFDVELEYKGRICRVKRQISVVSEEKGFYHGYVYHNNGNYLGHWYWNTKYLWPIFTSKQQNIGDENKAHYERAIRKALKGIGIYSKYMPESADRFAEQNEAAV